jgi:hypothetical protein
MYFQFDASPIGVPATEQTPTLAPETVDLLRQILEVQREQLQHLRAHTAFHDMGSRWKAFLTRWQEEFPDLSKDCRRALPALERAYGKLMSDLTEVGLDGGDNLDTDFSLQEFLDRYGMRLAQLGTILNLVGPLAEAGSQGETT